MKGICAQNPGEPCATVAGDTLQDARFSSSFPALSQFLNPPTGGDTSPCVQTASTACLQNGRFEVEVNWTTVDGSGAANAMAFNGQRAQTNESVFFQFFGATNFEMGLKILNACTPLFNNKFWVFISGLTDQGWSLRVRDTQTGEVKTYANNLGTLSTAFRDQTTFDCN